MKENDGITITDLLTFLDDAVPEVLATPRVVLQGIAYDFLDGLLRTGEPSHSEGIL